MKLQSIPGWKQEKSMDYRHNLFTFGKNRNLLTAVCFVLILASGCDNSGDSPCANNTSLNKWKDVSTRITDKSLAVNESGLMLETTVWIHPDHKSARFGQNGHAKGAAAVTFPPDTYGYGNNRNLPAKGEVTLEAVLNDYDSLYHFPGRDFTVAAPDGMVAEVETAGYLEFALYDSDGNPVSFFEPNPMEVAIPLSRPMEEDDDCLTVWFKAPAKPWKVHLEEVCVLTGEHGEKYVRFNAYQTGLYALISSVSHLT